MDLTLEPKACAACAKAKRKCGKQIPTCGRCLSRGARCEYPQASGTFSLPPRQPPADRTTTIETTTGGEADAVVSDALFELPEEFSTLGGLLDMDFDYTLTSHPSPKTILDLNPKNTSVPWYLEPDSWEIGNSPHAEISTPFESTVFMEYVKKMQDWQADWVRTGSSPYMHKYIYKYHMPRCIQDAYTLLATYNNATPATKHIALHLLEERVKQLLHEQPDKDTPQDTNHKPHPPSTLTPFEHLARVQALHIYQTIGLFDGAIRARHVAETQIPTLNTWMRAMVACAQTTAALGPPAFARTLLPPAHTQQQQIPLPADEAAWMAWVLSESIRRMQMVASGTQSVYLTLQLKWAPCPGSAIFHTRAGLWDAGSAWAWATAWESVVGSDGVDFVKRAAWERVFGARRIGEVDAFTRHTLEITFGTERMERWGAESASREGA